MLKALILGLLKSTTIGLSKDSFKLGLVFRLKYLGQTLITTDRVTALVRDQISYIMKWHGSFSRYFRHSYNNHCKFELDSDQMKKSVLGYFGCLLPGTSVFRASLIQLDSWREYETFSAGAEL